MKSLDKAVHGGRRQRSSSSRRSTSAWASRCKSRSTQLREAGRDDDADRINAAFAQFLDRIAARQDERQLADARLARANVLQHGRRRASRAVARRAAQPRPNQTAQRTGPRLSHQSPRRLSAASRRRRQRSQAAAERNRRCWPSKCNSANACAHWANIKQALDTFSAVLKERNRRSPCSARPR